MNLLTKGKSLKSCKKIYWRKFAWGGEHFLEKYCCTQNSCGGIKAFYCEWKFELLEVVNDMEVLYYNLEGSIALFTALHVHSLRN